MWWNSTALKKIYVNLVEVEAEFPKVNTLFIALSMLDNFPVWIRSLFVIDQKHLFKMNKFSCEG